jgi:hypothetical protein
MSDIHIHLRLRRRTVVWASAALAIVGLSYEVLSETLTMSTYYPAPSGIYKRLASNFVQFKAFAAAPGDTATCTASGMAAPCLPASKRMPDPGQLFYNRDKDAFYFSSANAQAGDPATWYKPTGLDSSVVSIGATASHAITHGGSYVNDWAAGTTNPATTIVGSGKVVRSPKQTSSGLFAVSLTATYCSTSAMMFTPTFTIYWRRWNSGGTTGWANVGQFIGPDSTDLDPSTGCADFAVSGMMMLPSANNGIDVEVKIQDNNPAGADTLTDAQITATRIVSL